MGSIVFQHTLEDNAGGVRAVGSVADLLVPYLALWHQMCDR